MKHRYTDDELRIAINGTVSMAELLRALNIIPAGGNYATLRAKIKRLKIDTSHWTRQGWSKGKTKHTDKRVKRHVESRSIPLNEILVKDSTYCSTYNLKNRLLYEGLKQHICENCLNRTWINNPIPLELHHVDGDRTNNTLSNLALLCPNCHALTDNYRGKNKIRLL